MQEYKVRFSDIYGGKFTLTTFDDRDPDNWPAVYISGKTVGCVRVEKAVVDYRKTEVPKCVFLETSAGWPTIFVSDSDTPNVGDWLTRYGRKCVRHHGIPTNADIEALIEAEYGTQEVEMEGLPVSYSLENICPKPDFPTVKTCELVDSDVLIKGDIIHTDRPAHEAIREMESNYAAVANTFPPATYYPPSYHGDRHGAGETKPCDSCGCAIAIGVSTCDTCSMGDEMEDDLKTIVCCSVERIESKYRKGAKEHGGRGWEMGTQKLIANALDEAADLTCYLTWLEQQQQTIYEMAQNIVSAMDADNEKLVEELMLSVELSSYKEAKSLLDLLEGKPNRG